MTTNENELWCMTSYNKMESWISREMYDIYKKKKYLYIYQWFLFLYCIRWDLWWYLIYIYYLYPLKMSIYWVISNINLLSNYGQLLRHFSITKIWPTLSPGGREGTGWLLDLNFHVVMLQAGSIVKASCSSEARKMKRKWMLIMSFSILGAMRLIYLSHPLP